MSNENKGEMVIEGINEEVVAEPVAPAEVETPAEVEPPDETEVAPGEEVVEEEPAEVDPDAAPETVLEEESAAEVKKEEPKPDRLSRFRKGNELDEEAILQTAATADDLSNQFGLINRMCDEDPELREAMHTALDKRGMLHPDLKAARANRAPTPAAPVPAAPEVPVLSDEQFGAKVRELMTTGREAEAMALAAQQTTVKALAPIQKQLAEMRDEGTKRAAADRAATERQQQESSQRAVNAELTQVAKSYPEIVGVKADGKAYFKDKEVHAQVAKIAQGMNLANVNFPDLIEMALVRLKRSGKAAVKPVARTVAAQRPQITAAPKVGAVQPKVGRGEMVIPIVNA